MTDAQLVALTSPYIGLCGCYLPVLYWLHRSQTFDYQKGLPGEILLTVIGDA